MGDDENQNARTIGLGVVLPLAVAGGALALFPGWPAVVVGVLAIIVMALTAARLAADRGDEPSASAP